MPTLVVQKPPSSYFKPRTRNTRNKYIGANIRQSIQQVFDGMNGWEGMMAWAKENQTVFYSQVVPKLLPVELAESGLAGNITVIVQRSSTVSEPKQLPTDDTTTCSVEPIADEVKA